MARKSTSASIRDHFEEDDWTIADHGGQAWRRWKSNTPPKYATHESPYIDINAINSYVISIGDQWTRDACGSRSLMLDGQTVDEDAYQKCMGKLSRLWFRDEQKRQIAQLSLDPLKITEEQNTLYLNMERWVKSRRLPSRIPVPTFGDATYKRDKKLLFLALEKLTESYKMLGKLNPLQREELCQIKQAYKEPDNLFTCMRDRLRTQHDLDIKIQFADLQGRPVYETGDYLAKITDTFLNQYLWHHADEANLFPQWVSPSDTGPVDPLMLYTWCQGINHLPNIWDAGNGERVVMIEANFEKFFENIDTVSLQRLLTLVMDEDLVRYLIDRNSETIKYKDMQYINTSGVIRGLPFASFIVQYLGLALDISLLGVTQANEIAGPRTKFIPFCMLTDSGKETQHQVRLYCRYIDRVHMLHCFTDAEAQRIVQKYLIQCQDVENASSDSYHHKCLSRDASLKLTERDANLGRGVIWNMKKTLDDNLIISELENSFVSVYSKDSPKLVFSMCGFEVQILPERRINQEEFNNIKYGVWNLKNKHSKEITAKVFLLVDDESLKMFGFRVWQMLVKSEVPNITKIVETWNRNLISFMTYFREATVNTRVLDQLFDYENRIQTHIMRELNLNVPTSVDRTLLYTPKEMGGLGMFSVRRFLISQKTDIVENLEQDQLTANPNSYMQPWEREFFDSLEVWREYQLKRQLAHREGRPLTLEDFENSWENRGVPRIITNFCKNKDTRSYDHGVKVTAYFKQYQVVNQDPFWWIDETRDGLLWNLSNYRSDIIQALGGVEEIEKQLLSIKIEPHHSSKNLEMITDYGPTVLFIDYTNILGVDDGNINPRRSSKGVIFIFNPKSGQLCLKIISTTLWPELREWRLEKDSKRKVAKEVDAHLRSLPDKERPQGIIVADNGLLHELKVLLHDLSTIEIRGSEFQVPLQNLLGIKAFHNWIQETTTPRTVLSNLYNDWVVGDSAKEAFARLLIVLRALHVNEEMTESFLLKPGKPFLTGSHIWPSLTIIEWKKIQSNLVGLLRSEYAKQNNMKESEIRESEEPYILFGAAIVKQAIEYWN